MPLYVYQCDYCNEIWEKFFAIKDRNQPLKSECPFCKKKNGIQRIYDTGGFVDSGIINADKNMEKSGILNELNRIKQHHPYMRWKG